GAERGQRDRPQNVEIGPLLAQPARDVGDLLADALEVPGTQVGASIAQSVDPEHAVVARQDPHDVGLGQWVALPVVGKADDVAAAEHPRGIEMPWLDHAVSASTRRPTAAHAESRRAETSPTPAPGGGGGRESQGSTARTRSALSPARKRVTPSGGRPR